MSNSPLKNELGEWFNDPFADDIPASQDGSQATQQKGKKQLSKMKLSVSKCS
ncbi:MAG: hypothetical protein ACQPRI_06540 [Solitalea-like symbiont of Tyrophagus putrescentiae]